MRIRVAVSEVTALPRLNLLSLELERVKETTLCCCFPFEVVLFVENVRARPLPLPRVLLLDRCQYFHPIVEQRVRLNVIDDVEDELRGVGGAILCLEEEPLSIAQSVRIILEH